MITNVSCLLFVVHYGLILHANNLDNKITDAFCLVFTGCDGLFLHTNNFDTNTVIVGGFVAAKPTKRYAVVLGFSQYFAADRVVENSNFGVTLDMGSRKEPRYFYPQANGAYTSSISRVSIAFRGHLGPMNWRKKAE